MIHLATMCKQIYYVYTCGCSTKGEFKQCEEKYEAQSILRCHKPTREDSLSRNYCSNHLVDETKASDDVKNMVRS